jgi:hypothetical protein
LQIGFSFFANPVAGKWLWEAPVVKASPVSYHHSQTKIYTVIQELLLRAIQRPTAELKVGFNGILTGCQRLKYMDGAKIVWVLVAVKVISHGAYTQVVLVAISFQKLQRRLSLILEPYLS